MLNESGGDRVIGVCPLSAFDEEREDTIRETRLGNGRLDCAADQF
jgi:hypothetical protein